MIGTEEFIRQIKTLNEEIASRPFDKIVSEELLEEINKEFDLLRRLEATQARIATGELAPVNGDALDNMKSLDTVLKNGWVISSFSVIITYLSDIPLEERTEVLNGFMERYPILSMVDRFVIRDIDEVYLTDEYLDKIIQECEELDAMPLTERFKRVLHEDVDDVELEGFVNEYVEDNRKLIDKYNTANKSLTPALKGDFEKDMEILFQLESIADISEEAKTSLENFKMYIRNRYGNIENLEDLISKQREKYILEQARIAGEEEAKRILSEHESEVEESEETENTNIYSANDRFIISDVTGLVIDNQGLSIGQKASNIAYATGGYNATADPAVQEMMNANIDRIINTLMPSDAEIQRLVDSRVAKLNLKTDAEKEEAARNIKTQLIADKRTSLREEYSKGWKLGFEIGIAQYIQQGIQARTELQGKVERNEPLDEAIVPISFEELKYVNEHFELRKNPETEERKIFIRGTDTEVVSPRTQTEYIQSLVWVSSFGKTAGGNVNVEQAFADDKKAAYDFFVRQARRDLRSKGKINLEELSTGMEALEFGDEGRRFITSPDTLEAFARIQTVGAKARTEIEPEAPVVTTEGKRR